MKKLFLFYVLTFLTTMTIMAVPAKRGQWKTIILQDGTQVRVELRGDEYTRYWVSEDGTAYVSSGDTYVIATQQQLNQQAKAKRAKLNARRKAKGQIRRLAPRRAGGVSLFTGEKRALVILAQFANKTFETGHDKTKYQNILNKEGYTTSEGFKGSVHDYFYDQSNGQFNLQFDVVGPYTLSKGYDYYGKNFDENGNEDEEGQDTNARLAEFVLESVTAAKADVTNWKQYDWNDDGELDQVFILYAGHGEADSYGEMPNTIWPHMYYYSVSSGKYKEVSETNYTDAMIKVGDNIYVDTYACGSELQCTNGYYDQNDNIVLETSISGIGTFCHEFSHCMGYPDMYDTSYDENVGTGSYDLMCSGNYNDSQFSPAGYTSYEKWVAGWLTPIELDKDAVEVNDMKALSENGNAYVIYNDSQKSKGIEGEYYLLENRQLTGWDAGLPGKGLLILHVDYDEKVWECNAPNTSFDYTDDYGAGYSNDHERMAVIKANNNDNSQTNWAYPYGSKNSLTNTSNPAATVYNKNTDNSYKMNKPVTDITQNSDGTISFKFGSSSSSGGDGNNYVKVTSDSQIATENKYIFVNESNSKAAGSIAASGNSYLSAQNVTISNYTASGSNLCVFTLGGSSSGYSLKLENGTYLNTTAARALKTSPTEQKIWEISSTSDGYIVKAGSYGTIQYNQQSPRFLNYTSNQKPAVLYVLNTTTGIQGIETINVERATKNNRIYSIDGRYVGTDFNALRPGIYIVNGKKMMK